MIQKFEGTVVAIDATTFVATLRDLTHPQLSEEQATFMRRWLPASEGPHCAIGAVFTWTIDTTDRRQTSRIRFSRRRWTARMVERAKRRAARYRRWFGAAVR